MAVARHKRDPGVPKAYRLKRSCRVRRPLQRETRRLAAFEDAKIRATNARSTASSAPAARASTAIPASFPRAGFTLSISMSSRVRKRRAHAEVEEVFFVLKGTSPSSSKDENGRRLSRTLGPWSASPVRRASSTATRTRARAGLFKVMLGRAKPTPWVTPRYALSAPRRASENHRTADNEPSPLAWISGAPAAATELKFTRSSRRWTRRRWHRSPSPMRPSSTRR